MWATIWGFPSDTTSPLVFTWDRITHSPWPSELQEELSQLTGLSIWWISFYHDPWSNKAFPSLPINISDQRGTKLTFAASLDIASLNATSMTDHVFSELSSSSIAAIPLGARKRSRRTWCPSGAHPPTDVSSNGRDPAYCDERIPPAEDDEKVEGEIRRAALAGDVAAVVVGDEVLVAAALVRGEE